MARKTLINPYLYLMGRQEIGDAGADDILFPLFAQSYETMSGIADGEAVKCITLYLSSAYEVGTKIRDKKLAELSNKAANDWMDTVFNPKLKNWAVPKKCNDSLKEFICYLNIKLPVIPVAVWANAMNQVSIAWDHAKKQGSKKK